MKLGLHGIPSTICIGVLAAALFGTPIYEISKNRWPGHGYSGPKTWEGIRSGRAAKAIESSAASESALKEAIRPLYNEWMFQLAGITQPGVVVGPGGWLFPSQRLKDPGETAWKEMPKTVAVMAALARNLEQNGCRVIFELIPRKRDLYPDQLPHGIEYSSPYEPVRNALLAEGMRVPDLRPALKQEGKLLFLTNDNHWNPEGCHEAARVIAGEIQAMFADGSIPGEPVDVEFARGKEFEMIGYQQKLLGFRPESRLFKSFTNRIHEVYAIAQGKPDTRHLGLWSYSPITLIGTSFSAGPYYNASQLIGFLGVGVRTMSKTGYSAGYRVVELYQNILLGKEAYPEVLVWELPCEFPLREWDYYREPLESILAVAPGAPYSAEPIPLEGAPCEGLTWQERAGNHAKGRCANRGAFIDLALDLPKGNAAGRVLHLDANIGRSGPHNGHIRVRWFSGGITVGDREIIMRPADHLHSILVDLRNPSDLPLTKVRVYPFSSASDFELANVELWSPSH